MQDRNICSVLKVCNSFQNVQWPLFACAMDVKFRNRSLSSTETKIISRILLSKHGFFVPLYRQDMIRLLYFTIFPVDTLLYRVSSGLDVIQQKRICPLARSAIELMYMSWRSHIYQVIDFRIWHVPFLELVNISLTFTWTYLDVFLMMISIGLKGLFDTLHRRIEKSRGKVGYY